MKGCIKALLRAPPEVPPQYLIDHHQLHVLENLLCLHPRKHK